MNAAKVTLQVVFNGRLYYVEFGHTDAEGHRAVKINVRFRGRHTFREMMIWRYGRKTTPHIAGLILAAQANGEPV